MRSSGSEFWAEIDIKVTESMQEEKLYAMTNEPPPIAEVEEPGIAPRDPLYLGCYVLLKTTTTEETKEVQGSICVSLFDICRFRSHAQTVYFGNVGPFVSTEKCDMPSGLLQDKWCRLGLALGYLLKYC